MTREELITFGERFLKMTNDTEHGVAYEFITEALKLFKQEESVLDKIKAEIEQIEINGHIRDVECFRAGINTTLNVIDKYKAGE